MRNCSSEKPLRVVIAVALVAATQRGTGIKDIGMDMVIAEMANVTGIEKGSGTKTSIVRETATEQGREKEMKTGPAPKSTTSTSTDTGTGIATALLHPHPQVRGLLILSKLKAFEVEMSPFRSVAICSALVWPSKLHDSLHKDPDSARSHVAREVRRQNFDFKNFMF
jgi:hypothetical protein